MISNAYEYTAVRLGVVVVIVLAAVLVLWGFLR